MKKSISIIFLLLYSCASLLHGQSTCSDGDNDGDGLCNGIDPCPDVFNTSPVDLDLDGVFDECDNSPLYNPDQADIDGDGIGDVSDPCIDPDRDGVCGNNDRCPGSDDRQDEDRDGIPDGCDSCIDIDGDDICDDEDTCFGSLVGLPCDDGDVCTINDRYIDTDCGCRGTFEDSDGDGVCDAADICTESDDRSDYDGDGVPDGCDPDPACSACIPDDSGAIVLCHIPGNRDLMRSVKGSCEDLASYFSSDGNFASMSDRCGPCDCAYINDVDSDGDGVCDRQDECPLNPTKSKTGNCGCDDQDVDQDGVCDSVDQCIGSDDRKDEDDDGIPDGCDEVNYCIPNFESSMEWISKVDVGGQSFVSDPLDGFVLHKEIAILEQGQEHDLSVSLEYIDDICEMTTVLYLDRNHDGDYEDDGEEIYRQRGLESVEFKLTVDDLAIGKYRLRVMSYIGRVVELCPSMMWGDVEDMILEVIEPVSCEAVIEEFNYELGAGLSGLSGGSNWSSPWSFETDRGGYAVATGDEAQNVELGIVNVVGELSSLKRSVPEVLNVRNNVWFSIDMIRGLGTGSAVFSLGSLRFGVNEEEQFFIQDQIGDSIRLNADYNITVHIDKIESMAMMWVRALGSQGEEVIKLETSIAALMIEEFKLDLEATDNFSPLLHYIDQIIIGCSEEALKKSKQRYIFKNRSTSLNEVQLFPNPSSDYVQLTLDDNMEAATISIVDIRGEIVKEDIINTNVTNIDISNLRSGIYYLSLMAEGTIKHNMIVIQ